MCNREIAAGCPILNIAPFVMLRGDFSLGQPCPRMGPSVRVRSVDANLGTFLRYARGTNQNSTRLIKTNASRPLSLADLQLQFALQFALDYRARRIHTAPQSSAALPRQIETHRWAPRVSVSKPNQEFIDWEFDVRRLSIWPTLAERTSTWGAYCVSSGSRGTVVDIGRSCGSLLD